MSTYTIRRYEAKDYEGVDRVCLGAGGEDDGSNPLMQNPAVKEAMLITFSHYYTEQVPEHCYVAVDEADGVQGYVLCAPDFVEYERSFREKYIEGSANPAIGFMAEGTIEGMRRAAEEYPAHLHIDLMPATQGQGVGTRLIHTLEEHLKEMGVPGLFLCVSTDNEGAIKFYNKLGFTELYRDENQAAMGIKLA